MTYVITGLPGCGKTTVLGLFNQAQLIHIQNNDDYKFLLDPEYQGILSDIYKSMIHENSTPDKTVLSREGKTNFRMMIALKRDKNISNRILEWLKRNDIGGNDYIHLMMEVKDLPRDDITEYLNTGDRVRSNLKKIFEGDPLMVVLDASKFSHSEDIKKKDDYPNQDQEISSFFLALKKYIKNFGGKKKKDVWIMFTKMDEIDDEVMDRYNKKIGAKGNFLEKLKKVDSDKRNTIGRDLINEFLPVFGNLDDGSIMEENRFEDKYFFSWIKKSKKRVGTEGDPKLETRVVKGGVDRNEFPIEIYEDLIYHIKDKLKNHKIADSSKIKNFYNDKTLQEKNIW